MRCWILTLMRNTIQTRVRVDLNGCCLLFRAVIVSRGTQPCQIFLIAFFSPSCWKQHSLRYAIYMQIHTLSYFSIMKCLKVSRRVKMRQDNWHSREEANLWITLDRKRCAETHPAWGSGTRLIPGSQYINWHMECCLDTWTRCALGFCAGQHWQPRYSYSSDAHTLWRWDVMRSMSMQLV